MIFGGSFLFENCSIISFSEYFKMFWSICQSFWSLVAVPIAHWLDFVSVQTFSFVESGQFWNDYFMLNLALMETILIPRRRDFETWYYCFLLSFTLALMKMLPPWPGPFNGHNVWSTNHNGCYLREKSPIEMKVSMAKTIAIILGYQCRIPGGARYKPIWGSQSLTNHGIRFWLSLPVLLLISGLLNKNPCRLKDPICKCRRRRDVDLAIISVPHEHPLLHKPARMRDGLERKLCCQC